MPIGMHNSHVQFLGLHTVLTGSLLWGGEVGSFSMLDLKEQMYEVHGEIRFTTVCGNIQVVDTAHAVREVRRLPLG